MKKNILFVVDEKQMGGVSVLLEDILHNMNIKKYHIDIAVLHNNGDYLNNVPKEVNFIYGTSFFETVDLNIKEVLKTKSIRKIYSKIRLIFLMKTGLIGKRIKKERKKMLTKNYDVEIAFKDGFCAIFTAYGNSTKKYHWLHTDYSMYDCTAKYKKLFQKIFLKFDKIIGISNSVLERFKEKYNVTKTDVIFNIIDEKTLTVRLNDKSEDALEKALGVFVVPFDVYGKECSFDGVGFDIDIASVLDNTLEPIGAGPCVFEGYKKGKGVKLSKNKHYFKDEPFECKVTLVETGNSQTPPDTTYFTVYDERLLVK